MPHPWTPWGEITEPGKGHRSSWERRPSGRRPLLRDKAAILPRNHRPGIPKEEGTDGLCKSSRHRYDRFSLLPGGIQDCKEDMLWSEACTSYLRQEQDRHTLNWIIAEKAESWALQLSHRWPNMKRRFELLWLTVETGWGKWETRSLPCIHYVTLSRWLCDCPWEVSGMGAAEQRFSNCTPRRTSCSPSRAALLHVRLLSPKHVYKSHWEQGARRSDETRGLCMRRAHREWKTFNEIENKIVGLVVEERIIQKTNKWETGGQGQRRRGGSDLLFWVLVATHVTLGITPPCASVALFAMGDKNASL